MLTGSGVPVSKLCVNSLNWPSACVLMFLKMYTGDVVAKGVEYTGWLGVLEATVIAPKVSASGQKPGVVVEIGTLQAVSWILAFWPPTSMLMEVIPPETWKRNSSSWLACKFGLNDRSAAPVTESYVAPMMSTTPGLPAPVGLSTAKLLKVSPSPQVTTVVLF